MARPSKYRPEFRRRAIGEVLDRDRMVTEVARLLSIMTPETLRRWVIQARIDRGLVVGPTTEEIAEIKALRKEVADQQRTNEILKAATVDSTGFSRRPPTLITGDDRLHRRRSGLVPGGGDVSGVGVPRAHLLCSQGPSGIGASDIRRGPQGDNHRRMHRRTIRATGLADYTNISVVRGTRCTDCTVNRPMNPVALIQSRPIYRVEST